MSAERVTLIPSCTCCLSGYHLPLWAGTAGLFADYGLDVDITEPQGRIDSVVAVASGRSDLCLTSVRNFLEAKQRWPRLAARYVFMISRRSHIAAFMLSDGIAGDARSGEDFQELDGASFLRSTDAFYMGAPEYLPLLDDRGLRVGTVIDVPYSELYEALARGRGDVIVTWLNLLPDVEAAARARGRQVRAFPFHLAGLQAYGSGIVANIDLIENRRDVVELLLLALRGALETVRADPGLALPAFRARYPDRDADRAVRVWQAGEQLIFGDGDPGDTLGTMDPNGWTATVEHQARSYGSPCFRPEAVFDHRVGAGMRW